MDSVLIQRWLGDRPRTPIHDQASITLVRDVVRALGRQLGLSDVVTGSVAIIVSELATNQLRHARDGAIALCAIERGGVVGIEVVAADGGAGIRDALAALDGSPRAEGSLGIGLSGVQRLADEVDFDVRLDVGTCVRARKFAERVTRQREVAVLGRNCSGETTSGDDAVVERFDGVLLLALADGLGHGPDAREPARRAIDVVRANPEASPGLLIRAADAALRGSRGAVMSVLRLEGHAETLTHAGLGNVTTSVRSEIGRRSYSGPNGVLGSTVPGCSRVVDEVGRLLPRDVIAMYSDGLRTRFDLDAARSVLNRHPLVIAQSMIDQFGRDNDDATIVVAR